MVKTNGAGQIESIVVSKSTGNAKVDRRALLFVKNTFAQSVPHPRVRHRYVYPVAISKTGPNGLRVSLF
ncbi:hypothetical protein [Rhizobium sp. TRM95796]|uniref:hypothetical protein n=1 Tax=Rhizobium sp. TRM95796 TaxID=2979862 RepID=UPI0021E72ACA|nr:hypothetical protein [Rhizobium sp. TRM95796]MCV3764592.1 hypothetical protein [Rhizobium sp. TRM95796]